ncbi:hypothetical protein BRARA_H01498 [Brassica rapa]|uniref:WAT1-related protein n=2 Tax=Brassica campestris TaxID=3711 RepID=A0A397YLJ4_BRACM|nr:hypothetical protein IGI04_031535 [Brassica rapa subsp. trilocularis]RID50793.1 hypothetical protein BRARA_H01498 [Brassica rapa]
MQKMEKYKPVMTLVLLQFTAAGVALFTKAAFMEGLSPAVFVVYRQAIATLFICPISFFFTWRKPSKPSLGVRGFWWVAFTAILGVAVNQNAYFAGIDLSSSSMASATTNLVKIAVHCPDHMYTTSWTCFMATIASFLMALALGNTDLHSWKLDSSLKLSCCVYSGLQLAVFFFLQAWCVSRKGPVFSALFNPLSTVIVTFFGVLCLKEKMYLGSLLGALAIILGLYIVLWGKSEDYQEEATELKLQDEHTNLSQLLIGDKAFRSSELLEPLLM